MDTFVSLHELRWNQNGAHGCFKSKKFLEFHREVSGVFAERGWTRLHFLVLEGQKVAGIYGYSYNDRYYFYLPGRNPAISPDVSTGILLLFQCVCQAIQDGCKEFDLLRGPANYKIAWANGFRRCLTLRFYNRNLRTAAFKIAESGKETVKILVR